MELGPVVRRVDNFIQRINHCPADKIGAFLILIGQLANFIHRIGIYPLDKVIHSSYNRALKPRLGKKKGKELLFWILHKIIEILYY